MVANILSTDPLPHTHTLGMGSIGQKSTFSEHGHVAYQIKRNHETQQRGRNMVEMVQVNLFLLNYSLKTS